MMNADTGRASNRTDSPLHVTALLYAPAHSTTLRISTRQSTTRARNMKGKGTVKLLLATTLIAAFAATATANLRSTRIRSRPDPYAEELARQDQQERVARQREAQRRKAYEQRRRAQERRDRADRRRAKWLAENTVKVETTSVAHVNANRLSLNRTRVHVRVKSIDFVEEIRIGVRSGLIFSHDLDALRFLTMSTEAHNAMIDQFNANGVISGIVSSDDGVTVLVVDGKRLDD